MWTPKRVLILFGALACFLGLFGVYSYFLPYDALPILPEAFNMPTGDIEATPGPDPTPEVNTKLIQAFGQDCDELRRTIKLHLRTKGFALAANSFDIEPDGRVKLSPFSACQFPKGKVDDDSFPEINAVQCEVAFLTLDQAISNLGDLSNRKIVGIELRGSRGVNIIHNRKTPSRTDDIEVIISNAPLFFDERKNLVWSEGIIKILDHQVKPFPMQVTAEGMEMHLAKDLTLPKTKKAEPAKKPAGDPAKVNGVEMLVLRKQVDMHLYLDPQSGFLSASDDGKAKKKPANADSQERSHLVIRTPGAFAYDLVQEKARFEVSKEKRAQQGLTPQQVDVVREHRIPGVAGPESVKRDRLLCDVLELQFRQKLSAKPGQKGSNDKEIESAIATAHPGSEVSLIMDTENLEAFGTELQFRAATADGGAQTMLKGMPLHGVKDGHKIEARELHMVSADKAGLGQRAFARGPGVIDMFDKSNQKRPFPMHAQWKDTLTLAKVQEDGVTLDLLSLTGDASFRDDEHQQELRGQKIQVWLDGAGAPKSENPKSEKSQPALTGSRQKPVKIEATGGVTAISPELLVKNTKHLVVRIRDHVSQAVSLPEALPTAFTPEPGGKAPALLPAPPTNTPTQPRTRKQIELEANQMVVYVQRVGSKSDLQELVCEGAVHVHQEPEKEKGKDKGVDIKGEMLNLLHHAKGDILYVFGDNRREAKLQLGELSLFGPKVTINQRENIAEVQGAGGMKMPSNTSLDGGKTAKPGAMLTVHWNKEMIFNGRFADFYGGVVALQDNGSLKCQHLQVTLDREVSFKEGEKQSQAAKVENMVCDQEVYVQDETRDQGDNLLEFRSGKFHQLAMNNQEGPVNASGPGRLLQWSRNGGNIQVISGKDQKELKAEPKLTRIDFEKRMFSRNQPGLRTSYFYENIRVYHLPADGPNATINFNKAPKNGFYLTCEQLTVFSRSQSGKTTQEMKAERQVEFTSDEFRGVCDLLKYDEVQGHIIFEALGERKVVIQKFQGNQQIRGRKILYKLKTGEFLLDGIDSIQSQLTPWLDRPDFRFLSEPRLIASDKSLFTRS